MNIIKHKMKILRDKRDWKNADEVMAWFQEALSETWYDGYDVGYDVKTGKRKKKI